MWPKCRAYPEGPCSPSPPARSPGRRGLCHISGYGWRVLGPGHGFTISELFFCPSAGLDKSDLSLLAPDYLQRRGVACKLSLGEGLPSGHL